MNTGFCSPLRLAALVIAAVLSPAVGLAQSGTLDQVSPTVAVPPAQTAWFNGDPVSLTWQAQVSAGMSGRLEGFTLQLAGNQGATLQTAIRMGAGWNTGPAAFQALLTKAITGNEDVFVDVTSANIQLTPGTLFVIEMQGQGTGCGMNGSYVPPPGTPLYAEPLFLGGPGCFTDCGWRIGFQTWVLGAAMTFCSGDGTGAACPCGNSGAAGNGCASSVSPTGGHLAGSGNPSIANDSFVLNGSSMPNSSALYFQGTTQIAGGAGSVFGDGLRCAGGGILRLGTKTNSGGGSHYPLGADAPVSVRGNITPGDTRHYQVWYRNAASFCSASTFNLTNGVTILWEN